MWIGRTHGGSWVVHRRGLDEVDRPRVRGRALAAPALRPLRSLPRPALLETGWPQCDAIETDYSTRAEDSEHPAGQLIRLEPALSRVLVAVLAEHSGEVDRA